MTFIFSGSIKDSINDISNWEYVGGRLDTEEGEEGEEGEAGGGSISHNDYLKEKRKKK